MRMRVKNIWPNRVTWNGLRFFNIACLGEMQDVRVIHAIEYIFYVYGSVHR
jgi:hypothetical protein